MSQHRQFTLATNVQVFFCDPHSPWRRGLNENTVSLEMPPECRIGRLESAA